MVDPKIQDLVRRMPGFLPAEVELTLRDIPQVPYVVENMIPVGGQVLLFGSPGVGKSPLVWTLANAVSAGTPFLDLKTTQGNVVLLSMDMARPVVLRRWFNGGFLKHGGFDFVPHDPIDVMNPLFASTPFYRSFRDLLSHRDSILVIIDALARCVTRSLIDDEVPNQVYEILRRWLNPPGKPTETALLLVHHGRKSRTTKDGVTLPMSEEDAFGSQLWRGCATAVFGMDRRAPSPIGTIRGGKSQAFEPIDDVKVYLNDDGVTVEKYGKQQVSRDARLYGRLRKWCEDNVVNFGTMEKGEQDEEMRKASGAVLGKKVSRKTVQNWKTEFWKLENEKKQTGGVGE